MVRKNYKLESDRDDGKQASIFPCESDSSSDQKDKNALHHGPNLNAHVANTVGLTSKPTVPRGPGLGSKHRLVLDNNNSSVARKDGPASEVVIETNTPKQINSLGALYKFSWKVFEEPSYTDVISLKLMKASSGCESKDLRHKVLLEAGKILQKSPTEKQKECENIIKDLMDIRNSCRTGIPRNEWIHDLNFYQNQEYVDECHVRTSASELREKYSYLHELLLNASVAIDEVSAQHMSQEAEERKRQHKLLVVALLRQTTTTSSIYRVGGDPKPNQWMYKIHLVGDSHVHHLYSSEVWKGVPFNRPHLHCKDDLSLFSLMETMKELIPKVSVKETMLVVCSVGLRDVIRTIDALGVLVTLENTIADMKKIREEFKSFYGKKHELLFADILPLDVCKLLELYKENVLVEDTEDVVSQCNETTLKLVKFTYLLTQNMLAEDLSRLKHLPPWEIFVNPLDMTFDNSRIKLPSLLKGVLPDPTKLTSVASRISYFHQYYYEPIAPPKFNSLQHKIFFVCNKKYSAMDKFWPKKIIHEKPKFIFLAQVTSKAISKSLKEHFPLPEHSILVIWFDASEIFSSFVVSDCTCTASALCVDIPRFIPPSHVYDELLQARKSLEQEAQCPNVMLTTLCPIDYPVHLKGQISDHDNACQMFEAPADSDLKNINKYLLSVMDGVNLRIVQSNRMRGLPAWDLCSYLYKRDSDGSLLLAPPISPCDRGPAKPQTAAKLMMCLSQCGQKTIKDLNWLAFCEVKAATSAEGTRKAESNMGNIRPAVDRAKSSSQSRSPVGQSPFGDVRAIEEGEGVDRERKRVCYGLKSVQSTEALDAPPYWEVPTTQSSSSTQDIDQGYSSKPSAAATDLRSSGPDEATLRTLIDSLRVAHEAEVEKLRNNPESHYKYQQERNEFISLAIKMHGDHKRPLNMAVIEQVWAEYWKKQLEASYVNTWEKRVLILMDKIGKGKPVPFKTLKDLSRLAHIQTPCENSLPTEKFASYEASLLNRVKKLKQSRAPVQTIKEVEPIGEAEKEFDVESVEKTFDLVQKGWRSIGCKESRQMLSGALSKLDRFINSSQISLEDRDSYIKVHSKITSFMKFLER